MFGVNRIMSGVCFEAVNTYDYIPKQTEDFAQSLLKLSAVMSCSIPWPQ